jgi:hypothetical protein
MITDDDDDDNQCDHQHDTGTACSCALALEIEQYGLFSTLHCRFVLDGEHCSNQECPYSHVRVKCGFQKSWNELCILHCLVVDDASTPPHCIICGEFLGTALCRSPVAFPLLTVPSGFPCSKCMQHATDNCMQPSAVLHCPLVQVRILALP